MVTFRATGLGVLAGLVAVFAAGWVMSLFLGGGAASDAVEAAYYATVLATAAVVAFAVSRRSGVPPGMAWLASALAAGVMLALGIAFYIVYFEFLLDDAFEGL
jgi:hypothetical protein